jgi:hypothetical protein
MTVINIKINKKHFEKGFIKAKIQIFLIIFILRIFLL